jgi:hypothetical protein
MVWRLGTFGSRSRAAMAAASKWLRKRSDASLHLCSSLVLSPIRWLGVKLWLGVCAFGRLLRWVFVPKSDAPLDVLKHYVSVLIVLIGAGALLWSAKQIAYPPLVITVAKLPEPLEKEYWLNPELSRTLIAKIEGLRAVVKGERDPAFEAVLNPPNIVVKTGEWSLNIQEQILTPLGSLLGRGQGEVHLTLNCYHPGCVRTTDKECLHLVPLMASDGKGPESTTTDSRTAQKQYLCLRLTADIQRGLSHQRLTPRLVVSPDDAEMTDAMASVARAVTTMADPATATLYFYRLIRERKRKPKVDADEIADLIVEASKAAEQAEKHDAVSACWAHTIRAHLAVDRREFNLAEIYLARARSTSFLDHLSHLTSPSDCKRLIMIAEMEFARQLSLPPEDETYPQHKDNKDEMRVLSAFNRVKSLLDEHQSSGWANVFGNSAQDQDLTEALKLVQAEIGLSLLQPSDQCELLKTDPVAEGYPGAAVSRPERETVDVTIREARQAIRNAVEKLNSLKRDEQLPPLTRQASLDLMSRLARNTKSLGLLVDKPKFVTKCSQEIVEILRKLDLNHPTDERVMKLLLALTEDIALRKTDSLGRPAVATDRRNDMIEVARRIHQRIAATGSDRTDALMRLAIIEEATIAELDKKQRAPSKETLQNLRRAWQRHERDINATRERGEFIVSFWAMVLMRSYPEEMLIADLESRVTVNAEYRDAIASQAEFNERALEYRDAIANKTEFEQALQTLYPNSRLVRLADLPYLNGIGPRIGCLCMLSYVTRENELADFFILRLNRWQGQIDQAVCRRDLIPQTQIRPLQLERRVLYTAEQIRDAFNELQQADSKTSKLQDKLEAHERAKNDLRNARQTAELYRLRFKQKSETVEEAAKACYVDERAPTTLPPSP